MFAQLFVRDDRSGRGFDFRDQVFSVFFFLFYHLSLNLVSFYDLGLKWEDIGNLIDRFGFLGVNTESLHLPGLLFLFLVMVFLLFLDFIFDLQSVSFRCGT